MTTIRLPRNLLLALCVLAGACEVDPLGDDATEEVEELGATGQALASDTLEQFAQKCDDATGVTVEDFDCDAETATAVPTEHAAGGKCDQPNRLNKQCDPGSKFQVLVDTPDAYVVAHCRKIGHDPGEFGDIAVIQHNKKNGATCFYQALGTLPGQVKAPGKGVAAYPWKTPAQTAAIGCVKCHDNGPIIRSPYISGLGEVDDHGNKLPGDGDIGFNRDQPYYFVGNDFASWKAYKVEVAGNMCNACHRMGVSNIGSAGTSLDLGLRATAESETAKNPHGPDSPIWTKYMTIDDAAGTNRAVHRSFAQAIADCAKRRNEVPLPSDDSCRITQFSGKPAPTVPGSFTAVWTRADVPEIQVYGWTYSKYRSKYDELWGQGWRLHILQPYQTASGALRYNAVWRQTGEDEIQAYGWTYAEYRAKYDELWPQGWRLKILQPYVIDGELRYTAVWIKSTAGEIQVYGRTYDSFRAKYDELWPQGWRLKLIQPYVIDGQLRYTAVWRKSSASEIQVYGRTYASFRAKYDQLWPEGWRLQFLQPYVIDGAVRYTAVWRKSTADEIQVYGWSYAAFREKYDELWPEGWRLSMLSAY